MSQSYTNLLYHIIFSTNDRQRLITAEYQSRLYDYIAIDAESNSMAVIMKHISGNMISRWTDFLTSDGEKPDRDRDAEFVIEPAATKDDVIAYWRRGWACLFNALEPLQPDDFDKQVLIRGEAHTLVQAINRQLTHYAYHIGQIVFLAKHLRSTEWQSISVPRNRSAQVNAYMASKPRAGARTEHRFDFIEIREPKS